MGLERGVESVCVARRHRIFRYGLDTGDQA